MTSSRILLGLAVLFLVSWGLTLLVLRGTVAYALGDLSPLSLDRDAVLDSHVDRFVQITGTPSHDLAVVYRRYGVPSYWYPLLEYDRRFIVKTDAPLPRSMGFSPHSFEGRLRPMQRMAFSSYVIDRFLQEKGLGLPPDRLVVSAGESPQLFRPMLLMGAPVTAIWLGVLVTTAVVLVRAAAGPRRGR